MKKIMTIIISFLTTLNGANTINDELSVMVDRLEDNNYAVVEVSYENAKQKYHNMIDISQDEFNEIKKEGEKISATKVYGKIYEGVHASNSDGKEEYYYQFKSDDNEVWWLLTEEELGFTPVENETYILFYYDNGTTIDNKPCSCLAEYECECELYDDIFLGITSASGKGNEIL